MKKKQLCINISRRNKRLPDLIEDYALEYGLSKADTIDYVFKQHNKRECLAGAPV